MKAEDVRNASARLPERQREALSLYERERRSYKEIAAIMGTSRDSVAQLISRARINLYDDLWGTALASIATPSPECERALPLLAARHDGELETSPADTAWLDAHLADCDRCQLGEEQMREAAAAYSSGPPLAVAGRPVPAGRSRRRVTTAVASVAALLLLTGLALAFAGGDRSAPVSPAAGAATGQLAGGAESETRSAKASKGKNGASKRRKKSAAGTAAATTAASNSADTAAGEVTPTPESSSGTSGSGGQAGAPSSAPGEAGPKGAPDQTGVEPTRQTVASRPSSRSKRAPTSTATSHPTTTAAPAPAPAPPPTEEPADGPGRSEEAPGKPAGRPPR